MNHCEGAADFVLHGFEIDGQHSLLRIDHYICVRTDRRTSEPHGLAQATLHAIALDRSTECATYGESDAKPFRWNLCLSCFIRGLLPQ